MMLTWFHRRRQRKRTAQNIYGSIVAQARQPAFYAELRVPDTIEGRFELLVIHLFLAIEALRQAGKEGQDLSGDLVDMFAADMDATLREMGIGDLKVPKHMRSLAEVLHDRMGAYRAAVAEGTDALAPLLTRHVYRSAGEHGTTADRLARYMSASHAALTGGDGGDGSGAGIDFAPVTAAAARTA